MTSPGQIPMIDSVIPRCNLHDLLRRTVATSPERLAWGRDAATGTTYAALAGAVEVCAMRLREHGLASGDRLAVLADNCAEQITLHFAAARDGLVLVPCNTRLSAAELRQILELSGAKLLVHAAAYAEAVRALGDLRTAGLEELTAHPTGQPDPRRLEPPAVTTAATPAQLYFTSGTTGTPKGVVLTHGNVTSHALSTIAELRLAATDVWLHAAPMFHLADAWATWAITAVGGRHAFLPRFDASSAFERITTERVTLSNLVPTMLGRMVHLPGSSGYDTSSLRVILSGGAPIAPETVRRILEVFGCDYVQTYGMTETAPYLTMSLLDDRYDALPASERLRHAARTGRPVLGVDLRVVGDDGAETPRDDRAVGEIQVRGPSVTPGYWQNDAATAEAFTADGYLRTGDLATIDATGSVQIVDRKKDVILTGGETVYSTEVENRLYEHEDLVEVAVYALPDPDLGERVSAAVVLREGAECTEGELRSFCREKLAGYKTPRSFRFLAELPRTGSGKIAKRMLRNQQIAEQG